MAIATNGNAKEEYARRLEARATTAKELSERHKQAGNLRLVIALVFVAMFWMAFIALWISPWWLLAPLGAFVALAIYHEGVVKRYRVASRAANFYERAIDRLQGRWEGKGESGERFRNPHHPYSEDLDLFGRGSVFDLICATRTRAGEETLARWLLEPAPLEEVRARQEAIEELRSQVDLREQLAVLGENVRVGVHSEALAAWGEAPSLLRSTKARILLALIAVASVICLILSFQTGKAAIFCAAIAVAAGAGYNYRERVQRVIQEVEMPSHDLALLRDVLMCLERQQFRCRKLAELRAALSTNGHPPSKRIAQLNRLIEMLDSRDNPAVRVLGPPLLWSTQLAFAIEAWRRESGRAVRQWLEAVGELEALCSLAAYSFAHEGDPFPEFVEDGPCFDGEGLTHPMLVEESAIRNDIRLNPDMRLLVVSGSNMSGKSTLLRMIGVNAVLAMAGAPVRARRLQMSPLAVGASIRVTDSLQEGSSRFYAEILRLRQLVDLASNSGHLLYLLDELLHGTNSHDRKIGAEAVVRTLVAKGAIGVLTTHDLALAQISDVLAPHAANKHFEDHLENGRISFDYTLREGVVKKSNALELMRSVGLEV
jgi:hypothetical protein